MTSENSSRDATNSCKITSEYFSNNLVMDESPKEVLKEKQSTSKKSQSKPDQSRKRPNKKIKGQKDIRTLIKSKKNELLKYTKDFDLICKQSGIDVDPEQLQLAIALSKSLQDNKSTNDETDIEKSLTCNQRRNIIRTTLQEYGFKTKTAPGKKVKKYRKHYKLILVSEAEKKERIADKFAEILIKNVCITRINGDSLYAKDNINSYLYNLTTGVTYDCIKNDATFYVNDLIPRCFYRKHIFKDWSEIPGRPVSPKLEREEYSLAETECSQEELDNLLSGPIDIAQSIIKRLYTSKTQIKSEELIDTIPTETEICYKHLIGRESPVEDLSENKIIENTDMSLRTNRGCSPDLFDDDVTIIMDDSEIKIPVKESVSETIMVKDQNDSMELTNCIGTVNSNYTESRHITCLSQDSNKTKINANDFMDLTECIPAHSQKNTNHLQNSGCYEKAYKNSCVIQGDDNIEVIDLNSSLNFISNVKPSRCSDEKSLDDTIIMVDEDYRHINTKENCIGVRGNLPVSSRILNPMTTDSMVDLEVSLKNNIENNYDNSYQLCNNSFNDFPRTIPDPQIRKTDCDNEDNKESSKSYVHLDTVDLTQPSNSEDCLSLEHVASVKSIVTTNTTATTRNLDHNNMESVSDYEKNHYMSSEKSKHFEAMDLTQSSNSEDCLQDVMYEACSNKKSIDNTITIYDDDCNSANLVNNKQSINSVVHCVDYDGNSKQGSNSIDSKVLNTENTVATIFDTENDREFDNLIESVSNSKKSNLASFDLCEGDVEDDNSIGLLHNSKVEDEPNNQEFDLTQRYDSYSDKLSGSKDLINKSGNISNDAQRVYDYICNDSCVIEVDNNELTLKSKISNLLHNSGAISTDVNVIPSVDGDCSDKLGLVRQDLKKTVSRLYNGTSIENSKLYCENKYVNNDHDIQDSDIDLTQQSDGSDDGSCDTRIIELSNELGKRNNISVDYDEVCYIENVTNECEITPSLTNNYHFVKDDEMISKDEGVSGSSQHSEVFELSDNEFNYSVHQHTKDHDSVNLEEAKFDIGGISLIDEFLNRNSLSRRSKIRCSCSSNGEPKANDNEVESCIPTLTNDNLLLGNNAYTESKSCEDIKTVKITTPLKCKSDNILVAKTPKHDDYIIKTDQVTPMPNYEIMTTPERNEELDKFGIKPLKRKRAVQILTHIYNQTHPLMEVISNGECASPSKIRRMNDVESFPRRALASHMEAFETRYSVESSNHIEVETNLSQKSSKSCKEFKSLQKSPKKRHMSREGIKGKENDLYEETTSKPDIRNIECSSEDWVFQKREKAKVHSCRVPLHIAFHNYVSSHKALREAILKYEPINIDDVHKGLVAIGYRYNPKDLLKFMDKKCITVKTADNARKHKES